jgi:hypothetical protein
MPSRDLAQQVGGDALLALGAGKDGYERVLLALNVIPPASARRTSGVLPQHLYRVVFPASPEQGGPLHLFVLFCDSRQLRSAPSAFRIRHRVESGCGRLKSRGGKHGWRAS